MSVLPLGYVSSYMRLIDAPRNSFVVASFTQGPWALDNHTLASRGDSMVS